MAELSKRFPDEGGELRYESHAALFWRSICDETS
jgi:hypothetical protein